MIRCNIALLGEQIHEIGRHIIAMPVEGIGWFDRRGIDCNGKGAFCLLNKKKDAELNHWNILCNGAVFNFNGDCINLPIFHLKKQSDKGCILDYKNCDLVEIVSGLTLGVFWPWGSVDFMACNTKTAISTYESDSVLGSELRKAKAKAKKLNIRKDTLSADICLTFKVRDEDLYLVHGLNLRTYYEYTEDQLDVVAQRIQCMRPLKFICKDGWRDVSEILKTHRETFLLRDRKTGERGTVSLKLSRPKLLETGKYKYLLPYWQSDTQWQVTAEFPAMRKHFDYIDDRAKEVVAKTITVGEPWATVNMPKLEMFESMKRSNVPGWMFKLIAGMATRHKERWPDYVLESIKKMTYKQIICVLGLEETT